MSALGIYFPKEVKGFLKLRLDQVYSELGKGRLKGKKVSHTWYIWEKDLYEYKKNYIDIKNN